MVQHVLLVRVPVERERVIDAGVEGDVADAYQVRAYRDTGSVRVCAFV